MDLLILLFPQLPSSSVPASVGNLTELPQSEWPEMVTFNKRAPKPNLSYFASSGLIGLYVSVVLTIGLVYATWSGVCRHIQGQEKFS